MLAGIFPLATGYYQLVTGRVWKAWDSEGLKRNIGLYHDQATLKYIIFQSIAAILLYHAYFRSRIMALNTGLVVFFASWLRQGDSTISYKLVCEQPGTFRVIPTRGEAMYSPFVEAISDSGGLVITEKPEK